MTMPDWFDIRPKQLRHIYIFISEHSELIHFDRINITYWLHLLVLVKKEKKLLIRTFWFSHWRVLPSLRNMCHCWSCQQNNPTHRIQFERVGNLNEMSPLISDFKSYKIVLYVFVSTSRDWFCISRGNNFRSFSFQNCSLDKKMATITLVCICFWNVTRSKISLVKGLHFPFCP